MTATDVFKPQEVVINGVRYPVVGNVYRQLISHYPGKLVIGDTSQQSRPYTSLWSMTDWTGGIGIERLIGEGDVDRLWRCNLNPTYNGHLVLGPDADTIALPAGETAVDAAEELGGALYIVCGRNVYKRSGNSWVQSHVMAGTFNSITHVDLGGEDYLVAAHAAGVDYTDDGVTWTLSHGTEPGGGEQGAVGQAAPGAPTSLTRSGTHSGSSATINFSCRLGASGGNSYVWVRFQYQTRIGNGDWSSWQIQNHLVSYALNKQVNANAVTVTTSQQVQFRFWARTSSPSDETSDWVTSPTLTISPPPPSNDPPSTPSAPSLSKSGTNGIYASWSAPSQGDAPITDYDVRIKRGVSGGWTTYQDNGTTRNYTFSGLTTGYTYYVEVRATNTYGNSSWSNSGSLYLAPSATVPGAVGAPTLSSSGTSITASWSAPSTGGSAITRYDIQYATSSSGPWTTRSPSGTGRSYTITGLSYGNTYYVRVRARNSVGNGAYGGASSLYLSTTANNVPVVNVEVTVEAPDSTVPVLPTAPTNLTVLEGNRILTARWDAPSNEGSNEILHYDLRYRTGTQWTVIPSAYNKDDGNETHTLRELTNDTEYQIQVRAVTDAGDGPWTDTVTGTPEATLATEGGLKFVASLNYHVFGITESGVLYNTHSLAETWEEFARVPAYSTPVTAMLVYRTNQGVPAIYVLTETRMWLLDYELQEFIPTDVTWPRSPKNGVGATVWRGEMYIPSGLSVYRYTQQGVLSLAGPDGGQGWPYDGEHEIVQLEGSHNYLLAVVKNTETAGTKVGTSHLLAWNGIGWFSMWEPASHQVLSYALVTTIGGEYAAWLCYGSLAKLTLPTDIINPAVLNAERRYAGDGEAITPWFTADEMVLAKLGLRAQVQADNVSATETVKVEYALDFGETWTLLKEADADTVTVDSPGLHTFPLPSAADQSGISFRAIRFRITLARGADAGESPDLQALSLEYEKILQPHWGWDMTLDLSRPYNNLSAAAMREALIGVAEGQYVGNTLQRPLVQFNYRREGSEDGAWPHWAQLRQLRFSEQTGDSAVAQAVVSLLEI